MGMKKIEEKETFEKTIGCVMHQVGTSRSNKEGAAARWWDGGSYGFGHP